MNGQWPGTPQPPLQHQLQQQQQQQLLLLQQTGSLQPSYGRGHVGQGPGHEVGSVAGGGDVLPSSEELEIEAMKRGMPPLEHCLRRCPRCLQGVPIRSMMCQHCQYLIPVSAKAIARREMKEAAALKGQQGVVANGGPAGPAGSDDRKGGGEAGVAVVRPGTEAVGDAGGSDSDERPRQKRKRQSTKKGMMTATEEELAELDEGLSEEEQVSWRKSSGQRRAGRVQTDKRKKKCPSCNEMNPMSVKICRECDSVFPVGARLDSAVTSEELREKFSFEPEFNKDGTPMIEKILGRRPIKEPDPDDEDAISVLKKHHRPAGYGRHYECMVKFWGVAYNMAEWMSDLDIRSLGMVASRMLTNYIKSKEREEQDRPEVEEDEIFDPAYLEVEKVLDAKVFKMEREAYPDGFDPDAPAGKDEEAEFDDADFPEDATGLERTPPPEWEDDGVQMLSGRRTREDPEWRPMTRCRHVLATLMEDDLSSVFHEPVDLEAYPTYSEKVDEPMDFGTIKGKLDKWEYRRNDPIAFQRDMRLVFTNCKVFNKYGSTIWYIADYLQAKFERLFQAWVMNYGDKDDRIPWEEPRARPWEEWCRTCLGPELRRNRMLLCDTCDAEYHSKCLGFREAPKGQWLCPICTIMLTKGQTLFSHQTDVEKARLSQLPQPEIEVIDVKKYLVKWSGLSYQFCTWETREELNNDEAIEQFHKLNDHPPLSPPMSEEELVRCLSQTNHDVLPALLEPSSVLEHNAQIYSQVRAFHFLKHGMSPPAGLLAECGKPAASFAAQKKAVAKAPASPSSKDEEEIRSLLFDMKQTLARGKRYDTPPRTDIPALPMHEHEYEVTLPKEHGSLFMNIHQQSYNGLIFVAVSSLCPRMHPRQHEPTPVMRSHMVSVNDVITGINGMPMLGFDTTVVANVLQNLPACVTLRLVKYGAEFVPAIARTQAAYRNKLGSWLPGQPFHGNEAAGTTSKSNSPRWQDRIEAVSDRFTQAAAVGGGGVGTGEAVMEAEHRAIEDLGQKRRLLMAVNESKQKPNPRDWSDVSLVYSLADYVYAHENMGHMESLASRRHDPRAKAIEQLHPETGEVVKVWPSMTAASVALFIGVSALSACVNGVTAQAGRWKWRFASKHTATALKMGVYRKHRVADISGGVGAYLEPEAAAAQIASGKKVDYESDDGFGDALVARQVDVEAQVPKAPLAGDGVKKEEPDGAGSAAAKAEPEAAADVALKEEPHASENGDPAVAEAKSKAKEEPCSPTIDVQAPSPLVKEDEDEEDIDVDVDPSDSMHAPEQKQLEMEQGQRAQVERRLAEGLNVHKGQGIAGTNGGEDGSGHRPLRDGEPGVPDGYDGEDDGSGLGAHGAGGPTAGVGRGAPGRPRGRPKRSSFEGSERGPSVALSSVSEEDEVDWDDSADEDMDAATAEAMEQARIDMARAAARDLRESRATRAQMMDWPYKDGSTPDFKNKNVLRDYQRRGVNWMVSCWRKKRRGCILADEMGLGKTVQVVTTLNYVFMNSERERGPFLVVVPLTTIEHWRREVEAWTEMNLCVYHDSGGRDMRDLIREYEWYYSGRSKRVLKFHVLVTTYDDVISDAEMLAQVPWRVVVVDEAHRMRNKNSALLGCLQQVVHNGMSVHSYQHRILMTGTPMQNIKEELWPLMNFIDQSNFPDLQRFQDKYCKGEPGHEVEEARALRRRLKPYMLRRRKEDVTKDIPPKEETIIDVELTMVQKKYYRAIYERNHSVLNKVGAGAGKVPSLMNIQMELRKCCNHPFMVRGVEDHEVDHIVGTMMEEAQREDPDGTSGRLDPYRMRQLQLEKGLIHTSGKMILLDKLLPKLRSEGHKVLIFSQFIGMLDMIQEFLALRGHRHERLDGRTTGNERQKSIDRFNREPNSFVFLLSTRAGGVGINLTAADTCIIYDSDWNPQNDVQAMARCHRIGQTKSVMVYRLITRNCFESEMFNRASMKLGLEQAVLGDAAGSLKPRDMEDLLKKGAYALTQMDEMDAMREFQAMDIDSILERKSRVLVEEPTAKGLGDDSDNDEESDKEDGHGAGGHRVTWRSFGGGAKSGPSLEDPDFWRKVMPDVMSPESMVSKLDELENKENDGTITDEEKDTFMEDLRLMVTGLRKFVDEDEREKGVQLLVRVTCKRELFTEEQCAQGKRWELELQGTRLRQAARQDHVLEPESPEEDFSVRSKSNKSRRGERKSSSGRRASKLDDDFEPTPKAKISAAPGGKGSVSKSGAGGKGGSGRDHNMDLCDRCEDGGVIIMCDGPCQRSFHPACLGMDDKPDEDPWMCNRCSSKVQSCLECGEKGPEMDSHNKAVKVPGGVSRCQLSSCGRFYHKECLKKMDPDRASYSKEGNFKCPQHFCFDCGKTSTNLGPRTLSKCLRCAKARCPDCLSSTRYVRKGKWMLCSDHEWGPLDEMLFEEQERQRKLGGEKAKRKTKIPPQPSLQFSKQHEAKLREKRAAVCYFCKGDADDPDSLHGAFVRPPFIQKTIKHGDMPIWLHANCMLYAPGCSVQHHHPEASPEVEGGGSGKSSSTATPSKGSSSKSTGSAGQEAGSGRGAGKSKSKGSHADGDGKKEDGEGLPQAVYFGVDEARKRVALKCTSCGLQGAVIGCHASSCQVNTHYACALKEGWEFGEPNVNGKIFLCVNHRLEGQVRFEKKTPAKKTSKKTPKTPGSKGKSSSSSSTGAGSTSSSKGKSKGKGRPSDAPQDDSGETSPVPDETDADVDEDMDDAEVVDKTEEVLKTPKVKKAKKAGGGKASGGGKGKGGKGGKSRPSKRGAERDTDPVVRCACGVVELEDQGYVQCEACESWMHLECAGITAEDSTSSAPFTCADCADSSPAVAAVVSRPSRSGGSGTKRKSPSSEAQGVVGDDADASITPSGTKQKSTPGPKTKGKIKGSGGSGGGATKGKAGAPKKHTSAPASVSAVVVASGDDVQDGGVPWAPLERGWEELNAAQKKTVVFTGLDLLAQEDPSNYFGEPVDPLMVPGYRDVVSRPLDFSTIRKRQQKGRYAKLGISKLWQDIATVYKNAQLFNQDESDCYLKAQKGLDVMLDRLKRAMKEARKRGSSSSSSSLSRGTPSTPTPASTSSSSASSNGNSSAAHAAQSDRPRTQAQT
ncbi:unnamed protein product, partial [Ascophyllum nodosum]